MSMFNPAPLWSARRTALAVVAAVGIASVSAVALSYADTGSTASTEPGTGRFGGPGVGGPGTGGGFGAPGQNGGAQLGATNGGTGQLPNPTRT
ncbi:MAG: hypothetical protein ACR2N4_19645 [Jatrophihabitans sp.]